MEEETTSSIQSRNMRLKMLSVMKMEISCSRYHMIWLILISLAAVVLCYFQLPEINWPIVVLGGVALAMLFAGVFFHEAFMLELKKRFHTN